MRSIRLKLRGTAVGVAAVATLALASGFAFAAIPDGNKVFTACVLNKVGTIRLIDKSMPQSNLMSHCTSLETEVSWNQQGQPGVAGSPGPAGLAGPAGPAGKDGADGRNGLDGTNGTNGRDGADGVGVTSAVEPPGAHCANGGSKFTAADGDETFACNGANGADGSGGASLDALDGSPCRNGLGTTEVTYGSNGSVTLRRNVQITLTVTNNSIEGGSGTVMSSPAGISCPPICTASYQDGTAVTLTATPSATDAFGAWGGDCSAISRVAACQLTMSAARHASADFAPGSTLTLTMERTNVACGPLATNCRPEATVSSAPAGLACGPFGAANFSPNYGKVCSATFPTGTSVTLTTSGPPTSWTGACIDEVGSTCTVVLYNSTVDVGVLFG